VIAGSSPVVRRENRMEALLGVQLSRDPFIYDRSRTRMLAAESNIKQNL